MNRDIVQSEIEGGERDRTWGTNEPHDIPVSHVFARGSLSAAPRRQPSDSRIPEIHRPPRSGDELSLGRVGLPRTCASYAMQGLTAKARAAYQDFLAIWKDADRDIPTLKEAKPAYANLQ